MPSNQKMKAPKKKEKEEERNKCTISCSAEGTWTNGACIGSKAKPIHLSFLNKEYATVNTAIGSSQCFLQCIKLHWDLSSLKEEKPTGSERLIVKKKLRTFSRSHCQLGGFLKYR